MTDGPEKEIKKQPDKKNDQLQGQYIGKVVVLVVFDEQGANAAFAPSEQAVDDARGILQAWEDGAGSGVVTYRGRMIENLHVDTARRTLTIHEAITARQR